MSFMPTIKTNDTCFCKTTLIKNQKHYKLNVLPVEPPVDNVCCKFVTEFFSSDFKIANPDFFPETSLVFSTYRDV